MEASQAGGLLYFLACEAGGQGPDGQTYSAPYPKEEDNGRHL